MVLNNWQQEIFCAQCRSSNEIQRFLERQWSAPGALPLILSARHGLHRANIGRRGLCAGGRLRLVSATRAVTRTPRRGPPAHKLIWLTRLSGALMCLRSGHNSGSGAIYLGAFDHILQRQLRKFCWLFARSIHTSENVCR